MLSSRQQSISHLTKSGWASCVFEHFFVPAYKLCVQHILLGAKTVKLEQNYTSYCVLLPMIIILLEKWKVKERGSRKLQNAFVGRRLWFYSQKKHIETIELSAEGLWFAVMINLISTVSIDAQNDSLSIHIAVCILKGSWSETCQ